MSNGNSPDRKAVALIAGPTASGKSDLAVDLSVELGRRGRSAVAINADSAQVYRDLAILSARPTPADMRGIDHKLFGTWDGAVACSAADWAAAARQEIAAAHAADAVPILVGGTGLYLRTLLDGIAPVPAIDTEIREHVRALPTAEAYAALQAEDPERAVALNANDGTRIARALEVVRSSGHPLTHWQRKRSGGIGHTITLFPLILLPEREWLYRRCDQRFARMIERGALEEVRCLLMRGLSPELPVMRAIGVPELAAVLRGEMAQEQAVAAGMQATRNYAKRQFTWFRRQPPEDWPRLASENCDRDAFFETMFRYLGLT